MTKMCVQTTGTSQKFIILAQKCPINLKYMCRLSAAHHMLRQQCTDHNLGAHVWLHAILVAYTALMSLNCILQSVFFGQKNTDYA